MPVHDWTKVEAGIFHSFHVGWIPEIQKALNGGLLPEGYYALIEQHAGKSIPDVLTLHGSPPPSEGRRYASRLSYIDPDHEAQVIECPDVLGGFLLGTCCAAAAAWWETAQSEAGAPDESPVRPLATRARLGGDASPPSL